MTRQQTTTHAEKGSLAADTIKDSTVQITNIINKSGNNLTPEQVEQREQQYLKRVMADSKGLEWLRLVSKENSDTPTLGLDSIYTALLTKTSKAADEIEKNQTDRDDLYSRHSALDMLNQHPRLALIGDPGSGKSAFVNYLCLCMAGELTGHPQVNLKALTAPLPDKDGEPQAGKDKEKIPVRQDWQHNALIPIRIILRDFAASRHFPDDSQTADAQLMMAFIQSDLASKDCADYFDILKARLRKGYALVMFDGLDEVPQAGERRKRLLECIEGFTRSYTDARILVTCRPYAYQDKQWRLADFVESELSVFHRGQILRFVKQWYDKSPEFDEEVAKKRVHKLLTAIFNSESLQELAERPLLLSLIAYLHANRHELPERKADLYERLLELLVNEWEKARFKTEDADSARELMQHSLAEFLEIGQDAFVWYSNGWHLKRTPNRMPSKKKPQTSLPKISPISYFVPHREMPKEKMAKKANWGSYMNTCVIALAYSINGAEVMQMRFTPSRIAAFRNTWQPLTFAVKKITCLPSLKSGLLRHKTSYRNMTPGRSWQLT